jgi:MFS family permease
MWIIGIPLSLLVRHRPEQYGYQIDGEQNDTAISYESLSSVQTQDKDFGVKQALKSRVFWHIGLAMTLQFLSISAVIVHVMPYLSTVGIPRSISGLVATALPLASIVGRVGSGWLGDKFNKKRVATGFFAIMILGLLFFMYSSVEQMWLLVPFFIFFGIGWGGNNTIRPALIREYFGISKFGTILGFMMGMNTLGGIMGPLFAGWVFDNWGSYNVAWLALACLVFAGLMIMATAPTSKYQR